MRRRLKILHIEDNEADAQWVASTIGQHFEIQWAATLEDSRDISADVVLLDLNIDGLKGAETVAWYKSEVSSTRPIVVLTVHEDSRLEAECKTRGAFAHYSKSSLNASSLVRSIQAALISDRQRREQEFAEVMDLTEQILEQVERIS